MARQSKIRRWKLFRRRCAYGYRVLLAALATGLVTLKAAQKYNVWQTPPTWLGVALIVVVGLGTLRESIHGARRPAISDKGDRLKANVESVVAAATLAASRIDGGWAGIEELNGRIYLLSAYGPLRTPYPERWGVTGISDDTQVTDVEWAPGKGALGRCWEDGEPAHTDWTGAAAQYAGLARVPEAEFNSLVPDVRQGFGLREFLALVSKYSEVLAVTIKNPDGEVVGFITLNRRFNPASGHPGAMLTSPQVLNILKAASDTAAKLISSA